MKKQLTTQYLDSVKSPETGRIEVSDTLRPGLRFRVSAKGHRTFIYEKRIKGGVKRKHNLGVYPKPMSLTEARRIALELDAEATRGYDRIALAEQERIAAEVAKARQQTVRQALDLYDDLHLSTLRRGAERKRQLATALQTHLDKPADTLTRRDIQAPVDQKAREGRLVYANRIRAALVAFTKWMEQRQIIPKDIGAGIEKAVREQHREHCPTIHEVRAIWASTFQMGDVWGPAFRLLILTGQRRGEILGLNWPEVQLDKSRILKPGSQTKNGKDHITHLSAPALTEMQKLAARCDVAEGLIFTTTGRTPISGVSKAKKRLDEVVGEGVRPWRLHDLRTAITTYLAENGVPEGVTDRILNHSAVGSAPSTVARVYNTASLSGERARALDLWASHVTSQERVEVSEKVVALRAGK